MRLEADGEMTAVQKVQALSILMKRIALSMRIREEVAGLVGQDWLKLLDQLFDSDQYTQGAGRYLAEAPYRSKVSYAEVAGLCQLIRDSLSRL
jgi:Ca-activated chloride channel family protein